MDAPTIAITRLIQGNIVAELRDRDERRAAVWFDGTWTGPHGNYTRATAGYVGTPFSAGLESSWKHMRRDTVGTSGSTMRMPLNIFVPNLAKHVSDTSAKHATKVLNTKSGKDQFQSVPSISTRLWKEVQSFDNSRLVLCYVEGSKESQSQWEHEMGWFYPADVDLPHQVRASENGRSMTEKIFEYHDGGRSIGIARTAIGGVLMPTKRLLAYLQKEHHIAEMTSDNLIFMQGLLEPIRAVYLDLFHRTEEWNSTYAGKDVEDVLDVMESFDR